MTGTTSRAAVVTGAAAGVGRSVARKLVEQGWITIAVDADEDGLSSLALELAPVDGGDLRPVVGDLTDPGSVLVRIEEVASDLDRLHGLANVAAVSEPLGRKQADAVAFERILRVNLTAPYTLAVGLWPYLSGGGRIVNVGSMSSFAPIPDTLGYASSKAGLNGLTIALNDEGTADDVSARCICLGWVETAMAGGELAPDDAKMTVDQAAGEVVRVLAGGEGPRGAIVYPYGRGGLRSDHRG